MPRGYASLADYYRAHREEMELACVTGCTPIEARQELRRRAKARRAACGTRAPEHTEADRNELISEHQAGFQDWESRWMMRD